MGKLNWNWCAIPADGFPWVHQPLKVVVPCWTLVLLGVWAEFKFGTGRWTTPKKFRSKSEDAARSRSFIKALFSHGTVTTRFQVELSASSRPPVETESVPREWLGADVMSPTWIRSHQQSRIVREVCGSLRETDLPPWRGTNPSSPTTWGSSESWRNKASDLGRRFYGEIMTLLMLLMIKPEIMRCVDSRSTF